MKNLFQITTVLFLLVQTIGFSQTKETDVSSNTQDASTENASTSTKFDAKKFLGKFYLAEANFALEIIEEDNKMYIVTEFSKDILIPKNETTIHELTRGVDLELIKDDANALKFTQNGYVTTVKRVISETQN
jgi:hypothetical protein